MKIGRTREAGTGENNQTSSSLSRDTKKKKKFSISSAPSSIHPTPHKCPHKAVIGLEGKFKRDGQ